MRKKREKRILRGTVFCGVLVALFVFCALPALAGENGTLLWWGRGDFAWDEIDRVRENAETANVDLIINEDGESLADFLVRSNPNTWNSSAVLYWVPNHGWGWTSVGGYTISEIAKMVEEVKKALSPYGKTLDIAVLGPCYAGNVEAMSCWAGVTDYVYGSPTVVTVSLVESWLRWIVRDWDWGPERAGNSFVDFVQNNIDFQNEEGILGGRNVLIDPQKALDFLKKIREKNVPQSVFQALLRSEDYTSEEVSDIWNLAEYCGLTEELKSLGLFTYTPESQYWEEKERCCYLGCWSGENEEYYIESVPEANRCIPGSSVTPDEPTPVPEGMASGGGGCMVGANNFPALLLLIPLTVVMVKRGKK